LHFEPALRQEAANEQDSVEYDITKIKDMNSTWVTARYTVPRLSTNASQRRKMDMDNDS